MTSPPLRVFTAQDVHEGLPWPALADAIADAFRSPPKAPLRHALPLSATDMLLLMPAWNAAHVGVKVATVIPDAAAHGGNTVDASYLLLDRRTGAPRALIDGDALTVRRTAATSVIAAHALANPDPSTLLVVGTGHLAPWMVRAYHALIPSLKRLVIWGRRTAEASRLARELSSEEITLYVAPDLEEAVRSADIVSCVTTARTPLIRGDWLRTGAHLDLVGGFTPHMREADDAAIARGRVVVDTREGAMATAGDLTQPLATGAITADHVLAELGEVLRRERHVRERATDVTVFKSVGHALEDLAAARALLHG